MRSRALKNLGLVVDHWTVGWQDYLKTSSISSVSPRATRPPLARQQSNGSGISPAPPTSRSLLRRDSSFKMQFEDVFWLDGDDTLAAGPTGQREWAYHPFSRDDSWPAASGDWTIPPTDGFGGFADGGAGFRFSNKRLRELDFANRDLAWAGRQVADETWGVDEMKTNLNNFYTWLLRFSIDCPFKDVRKGCRAVLQRAEVLSYPSILVPVISVLGPMVSSPIFSVAYGCSKLEQCLYQNRNWEHAFQKFPSGVPRFSSR